MINRPRGTRDITHPQSSLYQKINAISFEFLNANNYQQIILPTYEYQQTFSSLGESTDVVRKEMFTFPDRKERLLALRPEGTMGVVRAVCQNNLVTDNNFLKLYYWSNMFRYERPQRGRYREFWQLGVELVNVQGPRADFELLQLAKLLLEKLGVENFSFSINYLGNEETRERYKTLLRESLRDKVALLCDDCKNRYQNNPLRIMDCDNCNQIKELPNYQEVLQAADLNYLANITALLTSMNFNYLLDQKIVRGLDYYTGLVFEVKLVNRKRTLLGGGRYDNLFSKFSNGTKNLPAVGFAMGIDRLVDFLEESMPTHQNGHQVDLLLLAIESQADHALFALKEQLLKLQTGISLELNLNSQSKKRGFELINLYNPNFILTIGKNELANNFFSLKRTADQREFTIAKDGAAKAINTIIKAERKLEK